MGKIRYFLGFFALFILLIVTGNAMAVGYTCPAYRRYTSCATGYYMSGGQVAGNSCISCSTVSNTDVINTETIANGRRVQKCNGKHTETGAGGTNGAAACTGCTASTYTCECNSGYHVSGSGQSCSCVADDKTVSCSAGQYLKEGATTCTTCPRGSYCPGFSNYTIPASGATSDHGINACPKTYNSSALGASSDTQCYRTTTAGTYVATAKGEPIDCPAGYYCPSAQVYYGKTNAPTACPTPSTYRATDAVLKGYLAAREEVEVTQTSVAFAKKPSGDDFTGLKVKSDCAITYTVTTNAGNATIYYARYNETSNKYDTFEGGAQYFTSVNPGYYVIGLVTNDMLLPADVLEKNKALFKQAAPCPEGTYCEGIANLDAMPTYSASLQLAGAEECPSTYASSAAQSTSINECYLTTTPKYYVAQEGYDEITCTAGGMCPGGIRVYYGDTGGRTVCTGSTYALAGKTSCEECPSGYTITGTAETDHDQQSDCTAKCAAGTMVNGVGDVCSTPSGNWYVDAHEVPYGSSSNAKQCESGYRIMAEDNVSPGDYDPKNHDSPTDCTQECYDAACIKPSTCPANSVSCSWQEDTKVEGIRNQVDKVCNAITDPSADTDCPVDPDTLVCKPGYRVSGISCVQVSTGVTYSCGDGTGTPPSGATPTYNTSYTVAANTCKRPGYTFAGWNDGSKTVQPGQMTWLYTSPVTFTAKWTPCSNDPTAPNTCDCGAGQYPNGAGCSSCVVSCASVPTYTQGEYNVCESESDTICYRQCTTADVTSSTAVSGTVTKGGKNTCAATSCKSGTYLDDGKCQTCVANATCAGGTSSFVCNTGYQKSDDGTACEPVGYTITLDKNNGTGSIAASIVCYHNQSCALPSSGLTRPDYEFTGWGTENTCTAGDTNMTFTSADTLYACWSQTTTQCEAGKYYDGTNHVACKSGMYCPGTGYADIGTPGCSSTCPAGYDGSDANAERITQCYQTCDAKSLTGGTATLVAQRVYYDDSTNKYPACTYNVTCNPGYVATAQATANATCTQCRDGENCPGGTDEDARDTCAANHYCVAGVQTECPDGGTSAPGATASDQCSKVVDYTAVHGDGTQVCKWDDDAGTYSAGCTDITITSCDAGYYRTSDAATDCDAVGVGAYSPAGEIERTECAGDGTTDTTTAASSSECYVAGMSCPILNGTGQHTCHYADGDYTDCDECVAVSCDPTYSLVDGECITCPANHVCTGGTQQTCAAATGGEYTMSDAGTTDADMCYKPCDPVANAAEMSGRDYYGQADTCVVERCDAGYLLSGGACQNCTENHYCDGTDVANSCAELGDGEWPFATPNATSAAACYQKCEQRTVENGTAYPVNDTASYDAICQYTGISDAGNPCDIVDGVCIETSCNSEYEMINGRCVPCNREFATDYLDTGNCLVASCELGYHPKGDQCESDVRTCVMPFAVYAEQRWDAKVGTFGKCVIKECEYGYHIASNACVSDRQPCTVENGVGFKEWNHNTGTWGACESTHCDPGYTNDRSLTNEWTKPCGECKNKYNAYGDLAVAKYSQECEIEECMYQGELYDLEYGECVRICPLDEEEDDTGRRVWNPDTKKCETTCNPGYIEW